MVLNETVASVLVAQELFTGLINISYWAVGGAVGIAVLSFLAAIYTNRQILAILRTLVEQNKSILEELRKKRK